MGPWFRIGREDWIHRRGEIMPLSVDILRLALTLTYVSKDEVDGCFRRTDQQEVWINV